MLCQICGKNPATVHFTEIHDNKMSEIHVCERCAEEKGLHATSKKQQFDIADLLVKMVDDTTGTEEERVGNVQCPRCGLLYSGFRETGRLGCAECYTAFQFQLRPLLRRTRNAHQYPLELFLVGAVREGDAAQVAGEPDPARQHQVGVRSLGREPARRARHELVEVGGRPVRSVHGLPSPPVRVSSSSCRISSRRTAARSNSSRSTTRCSSSCSRWIWRKRVAPSPSPAGRLPRWRVSP